MVTTPRAPPMPETQRIYSQHASVGMAQKALYDKQQAERDEQEKKSALPDIHEERWNHRMRKDGTRPSGEKRIVNIRRNAKGKFLRKSKAQALAAHLGLMIGSEVPSPTRTMGHRRDPDPRT